MPIGLNIRWLAEGSRVRVITEQDSVKYKMSRVPSA